jgi:hypothetical protein
MFKISDNLTEIHKNTLIKKYKMLLAISSEAADQPNRI